MLMILRLSLQSWYWKETFRCNTFCPLCQPTKQC